MTPVTIDWAAVDAANAAIDAARAAGTWCPDFFVPTIFDRHDPTQAERVAAYDADVAAYADEDEDEDENPEDWR